MNPGYRLHRRWDRMGRLVGDPTMEVLQNSHVLVIGVGGVGSFAAVFSFDGGATISYVVKGCVPSYPLDLDRIGSSG